MTSNHKLFNELVEELLAKMEARGCTSLTVIGYRYLCNSVIDQLRNWGYEAYTKGGGERVLENYLKTRGKNRYYSNLRTVIKRLNDLVDGTWKDIHSNKAKIFEVSDEYRILVDDYCGFGKNKGLAEGTIRNKRYAISWFFAELGELGCYHISVVTSECIIKTCARITDHNLWGEIRVFLRYLSDEGITQADYSTIVPHFSKPYVIPSVYSISEIIKIENAVDRTTPLGLRDYAMILLASRTGMRSGDIVHLRLRDIDFVNDEINIIQQKTGKNLHLPLILDVKQALQNYLIERETFTDEFIFLNVYAPYNPVTTGTLRNALKKYMSIAGIDIGQRKRGPHSFRSSLASSMVNNSVAYETVRKVLGHSSNNAIKHYARIDVEKLRPYSLTPPTPSGNFLRFLNGEVQRYV